MVKDLFNKLFGETDDKVIAKLNEKSKTNKRYRAWIYGYDRWNN